MTVRHDDASPTCTALVVPFRLCGRAPVEHVDLNGEDGRPWLCLGWLCEGHHGIAIAQSARAHAEYGSHG